MTVKDTPNGMTLTFSFISGSCSLGLLIVSNRLLWRYTCSLKFDDVKISLWTTIDYMDVVCITFTTDVIRETCRWRSISNLNTQGFNETVGINGSLTTQGRMLQRIQCVSLELEKSREIIMVNDGRGRHDRTNLQPVVQSSWLEVPQVVSSCALTQPFCRP